MANDFYYNNISFSLLNIQPVLQYSFDPHSCSQGVFKNNDFKDLVLNDNGNFVFDDDLFLFRNDNVTNCLPQLGIESLQHDDHYYFLNFDTINSHYLLLSTQNGLNDLWNKFMQGISIELWFEPYKDYTSFPSMVYPIFTIGDVTWETATPGYSQCETERFDFQLAQRGKYLQLSYKTSDVFFEPCQQYTLTEFPLRINEINHVLVSLTNNHQQIFINGKPGPLLMEPFDETLWHWIHNGHDYNIQLFAFQNMFWSGRLYQVSLFHRIFDNEYAVHERILNRLPKTKPYAINQTIVMNEDAEIIPGSHKPEWYSTNRKFDDSNDPIPPISLSYEWLDASVESFIQSFGISSKRPNNNNHDTTDAASTLPEPFIYITKFPKRGMLYRTNQVSRGINNNFTVGSAIDNNINTPASALQVDSNVIFVPNHNEHSTLPGAIFTSFEFCVSEFKIFASTQCQPATVSIIVNAVHDPPRPIANPQHIIVHESITSIFDNPVIELTGKSMDGTEQYNVHDETFTIDSIMITSPPKFGDLFLSVSAFRQDGLLHGMKLSVINYTIPGTKLFVEYQYSPTYHNENHNIVQEWGLDDSFRFRVMDMTGTWSAEKQVTIQILSSLQVDTLPPPIIVIEDSKASIIMLNGSDDSKHILNRTIAFYIESLPDPSIGYLWDPNNNSRIDIGTIIHPTFVKNNNDNHDLLNSMNPNIVFHPTRDYCANTIPPSDDDDDDNGDDNENANENDYYFSYRAVALANNNNNNNNDEDDNNQNYDMITSTSPVVKQILQFQCRQDSITLTRQNDDDTATYTTRVANGITDNDCSGYIFNASNYTTHKPSSPCETAAIVENITVTTSDTNNYFATVLIVISSTTHYGYITLNRQYWDLVTPLQDQVEMRHEIYFRTLLVNVNDVLSFLHYQSNVVGMDTLRITLYYGDCTVNGLDIPITLIKQGENDYTSCIISSLSIPIMVLPPSNNEGNKESKKQSLFGNFEWKPLSFTILLLVWIKCKRSAKSIITTIVTALGRTAQTQTLQSNNSVSRNDQDNDNFGDDTTVNHNGDGHLGDVELKKIDTSKYNRKNDDDNSKGTSTAMETIDDDGTLGTSEDNPGCCRWIQYYDNVSGFYYYLNTVDGSVTWQAPLGESFVPADEE